MAEIRVLIGLMIFFLASTYLLLVPMAEAHEKDSNSSSHFHDLGYEKRMGSHHGLISSFYNTNGNLSGYLELKLHYVTGDLEVWLYRDRKFRKPFNVPIDSTINVTMLDKSSKVVQLKMPDNRKKQDKDDNATIRDNKTNYFTFSGNIRASRNDWLKEKDFKSSVVVSFSHNNETYGSDIFTLIPH